MQPSYLDGAFVGLGAGVGEERLPRRAISRWRLGIQQVGQHARHLAAMLYIVVVAHVDELGRLALHRRHKRRRAMAERHHAYAAEEVEVFGARVVVEAHPLAAHELHRLARERGHDVLGFEGLLFLQGHRCILP